MLKSTRLSEKVENACKEASLRATLICNLKDSLRHPTDRLLTSSLASGHSERIMLETLRRESLTERVCCPGSTDLAQLCFKCFMQLTRTATHRSYLKCALVVLNCFNGSLRPDLIGLTSQVEWLCIARLSLKDQLQTIDSMLLLVKLDIAARTQKVAVLDGFINGRKVCF